MAGYRGTYDASTGEAQVYRIEKDGTEKPLPLRLDLREHSPTGFNWGYGGSGPAQLALAILADHLDDDEQAQRLYQDFKWQLISRLPQGKSWQLSTHDIDATLQQMQVKHGRCI